MLETRVYDQLKNGDSLEIGPVVARRILDNWPYEGQRPLNEDRVIQLGETLQRGTFLPNTQISFGRVGAKLYLLNGQHRLNAIELSGVSCKFRIEIYECRDASELADLYCRFDQPGGQRSLTQISRALNLHDDALRPATAASLLQATPLLMTGLRRVAPNRRPVRTRDLDQRKMVALEWKPWAIDYQACLQAGVRVRTARYRSASVFAVALVTLRYQNSRAKEFWTGSIRNDALRHDDPRAALHGSFLSASKARKGEFDLAEAASYAWNAFYKGRPLILCKAIGTEIRLLGTPLGE